jgi:hypothetical protein
MILYTFPNVNIRTLQLLVAYLHDFFGGVNNIDAKHLVLVAVGQLSSGENA